MTGLALAPEASAPPARWTVLEVIRWTVARFTERDLATPRLDAELLVAHALGLPRLQLYVQFDRPLLPDELAAIRALIKRRQAGASRSPTSSARRSSGGWSSPSTPACWSPAPTPRR